MVKPYDSTNVCRNESARGFAGNYGAPELARRGTCCKGNDSALIWRGHHLKAGPRGQLLFNSDHQYVHTMVRIFKPGLSWGHAPRVRSLPRRHRSFATATTDVRFAIQCFPCLRVFRGHVAEAHSLDPTTSWSLVEATPVRKPARPLLAQAVGLLSSLRLWTISAFAHVTRASVESVKGRCYGRSMPSTA